PAYLPEIVTSVKRTGVYGLVTDPSSRPLADARVMILGYQGRELVTDSAARFALPQGRQGGYFIAVSKPGYADRKVTLLNEIDHGTDVTIMLVPGEHQKLTHAESQAYFDL